MKKFTLLLSLMLMVLGASAKIITTAPQPNTPYIISCIAESGHISTRALADDGTTLQGRHATGTPFILEPTGTEGQYYIKSTITSKYINAVSTDANAGITFDTAPSTFWTIDQTNADTSKHSWAIRPNGTAQRSLNNNGSETSACPWMKIVNHTGSNQGCALWTFDDMKPYDKPQFGGSVWTWNNNDAFTSTTATEPQANPDRANGKGPVFVYNNAGFVTKTNSVNTSDNGGLIVSGNSAVNVHLGSWAGAIQVNDGASASVNWGVDLKGTEPEDRATVWTNGTLIITNRTNFGMNDGNNHRWYIGEYGQILTEFTGVNRGDRTWSIHAVVADQPEVAGRTRTLKTLTKKVMTWGADISGNIASIKVFYKGADGTLAELENAVTYDATGITVTYQGLGYDEELALPAGDFIKVSDTKADFLTPATSLADNDHWYILTQKRGTDGSFEQMVNSSVYDNGIEQLKRGTIANATDEQPVEERTQQLVRFFQVREGVYNIQFATGNFISPYLNTSAYNTRGEFNIYKINNDNGKIGWNVANFANIIDNNGVNSTVCYWGSGQITSYAEDSNNVWSLYEVEFIDAVTVNYTLTAADGATYTGSYSTPWHGDNTIEPVIIGAQSYTLSNKHFAKTGSNYTLTADIDINFGEGIVVNTPIGIESQIGNGSKWFVGANNVPMASNAATTDIMYANQDNYKWIITRVFENGTFSYTIKNVAAGKYFPAITGSQAVYTNNPLVEEANAGHYYYMPCNHSKYGFSINPEGTDFLTVNSSETNKPIWVWHKNGENHAGSDLTFPEINKTVADLYTQIANLKTALKLDILEGSIVVGPGEFAAPAEINAAIDALNAVDYTSVDALAAFTLTDDAAKIKNYLYQLSLYHNLHTCKLTISKQYSTLILPCPSVIPDGMTVSTIEEHSDGTLTQHNADAIAQNKPYVVESTVGNKYTIIGWKKDHQDLHTHGWLTGVLHADGAEVPDGGYYLSQIGTDDNARQAFVKYTAPAASEASVFAAPAVAPKVKQYECYLTLPENEEARDAFIFTNPGTTEINEIAIENDRANINAIYDLQGRRLSAPVKGINIIGGRKVLVK